MIGDVFLFAVGCGCFLGCFVLCFVFVFILVWVWCRSFVFFYEVCVKGFLIGCWFGVFVGGLVVFLVCM